MVSVRSSAMAQINGLTPDLIKWEEEITKGSEFR